MATTNPVTGDAIATRFGNKETQEKFNNNFDAIFGVKPKKEKYVPPAISQDPLCKICGKVLSTTKECAWTGCELNWNEYRIDAIGSNGNEGLHYD